MISLIEFAPGRQDHRGRTTRAVVNGTPVDSSASPRSTPFAIPAVGREVSLRSPGGDSGMAPDHPTLQLGVAQGLAGCEGVRPGRDGARRSVNRHNSLACGDAELPRGQFPPETRSFPGLPGMRGLRRRGHLGYQRRGPGGTCDYLSTASVTRFQLSRSAMRASNAARMPVAPEVPRARRSGGLWLSAAVRMPAAIRAAEENADCAPIAGRGAPATSRGAR